MITVLTDGQAADRDLLNSALAEIYDQGSGVLADLGLVHGNALMSLERRLSALNGRRQRSNRTPASGTLASLVLTDFNDIDQSNTTATVRIDNGSASLWELAVPSNAPVASNLFSSDMGTVNPVNGLYQVLVDSASETPTGTFLIKLDEVVNASMVLLDIAATPSEPVVSVEVSTDGVTYLPADSATLEGYRITARVQNQAVQYIRLTVKPSHADNIDGTTFTFGVTDTALYAVQFQMSSGLLSRPILITPQSANFRFVADADPGIQFYLAINSGNFTQVASGDQVSVPGAAFASAANVAMSATVGVLNFNLPADTYLNSVRVADATSGVGYPLLPGLDPGLAAVAALSTKSIAIHGTALTLVPQSAGDNSKTFNLSYTHGPASIQIQLRALFTTTHNSVTPVFRGATFQEI